MATALHINTIHDIISAVEQSDSSHGIFTSNSTMRKRARYLVSEAHTLLSMLRFRGEMSRDAKAEYEYVYSRYAAMHATPCECLSQLPTCCPQTHQYQLPECRIQLKCALSTRSRARPLVFRPGTRACLPLTHSFIDAFLRLKLGTPRTTSSPSPTPHLASTGPTTLPAPHLTLRLATFVPNNP